MQHDNGNKQQKRQEGGLRFPWKCAFAATGILMLILSSGCAGQRGTSSDSAGIDSADASESKEEAGTTVETDKDAADTVKTDEQAKETPEVTDTAQADETATDTAGTAPSEPEWKEGYLNGLRTEEVLDEINEWPFLIREIDSFVPAYIDDDDIPELLFNYYHGPILLIYDPNDGFNSIDFGRNEVLWQERTGNLVTYFEYISGDVYLTEYHLTEGELEIILNVSTKNSDSILSYDWNGEELDREEFEVKRDTLLGQMTHNLSDEDVVSYSFEELCGILEGQPEKTADSESLLDAFLANEIPAIGSSDKPYYISFANLPMDSDEWDSYSVGERVDLDNDGENELILNGPYGGMYLDARKGNVYVMAWGDGTSQVLSHTSYDGAVWIVHSDTTHQGRTFYWLTKYDGGENIVDEFTLSAEYWDSPDGKYNANSDFTFRDQKISMEEYEALYEEIFG